MKKRLILLMIYSLTISCSSAEEKTKIGETTSSNKFLIITADDFGVSKNVTEGIKIAAEQKAISAISALTNFSESLPELKQVSESNSDIGIGVHLNITTGKPILGANLVPSLTSPSGNFYTMEELLPKVSSISLIELEQELRAQIAALADYGITIDHLSDHNGILSLYTPFFNIIVKLGKELNVPVRNNYISSLKYPELFPDSNFKKHGQKIGLKFGFSHPFKALGMVKYSKKSTMEAKVQKMNELGITHPDLLIDYFWGNPTLENYQYILENLPVGVSEMMLHLGTNTRQTTYCSGLDLNYFDNREKELKTLSSDNLKEFYKNLNIKIIGYSEILNCRVN